MATKPQQASLKTDSSAVSPVIGVILMVAITVVLAAVVFVMVTNLSKGSKADTAPRLSFAFVNQDASSLSFRVISQDEPVQYDTCQVRDDVGALHTFKVNGAAVVAGAKSQAADVLQVTGLTTKTTYNLALACSGATNGSLQGTTQ